MTSGWRHFVASLALVLVTTDLVAAKAILGVDLGSLYMKVALVQRNAPLQIVTNLHSKRKTEQMVLFDGGARFYGADASSLLARKPHLTPAAMSVMLGRDSDHPSVQVLKERHYPLRPESFNETRSGVCLNVDGMDFTPEELVAMVLTHARDISAIYGEMDDSLVRDCVLTVPSFYTVHERRALLDAAALADLNVLALIDETTAAALHYGMDRVEKEPTRVLFYNMGANALQVHVVEYTSYAAKGGKTVGAFEVKGKGWDATLGGESFDARLVSFMADKFNAVWNSGRDVRDNKRAMTKLRIQANKVKHVLSANTNFPVYIDGLVDDVSLSLSITRAEFEELCHDLLLRATAPIHDAIGAANMTLSDIHSVELIGGGMRVPKIQEELRKVLGMDLGLHINSDESMALGAAFHGANISTAFRVRQVGMTDVNPFPIAVSLENMAKEESDWSKAATLFKAFGKVGIKKTIAFSQDKEVHCELTYDTTADNSLLPPGTEPAIARYNVTGIDKFAAEMAEKNLGKPKVALQFELSTSGIPELIRAEATVEEVYTVTEEVEVDVEVEVEADDDAAAEEAKESKEEEPTATEEEENKEGDAADATKEETKEQEKPKKKKVTKTVEKEKKKTHKRKLAIEKYHVGRVRPYSELTMAESKAKLNALAEKDRKRIELEETKNGYEAFIYHVKNKLMDEEEELSKIATEEQREALREMASDANDWLDFEGWDADLETFQTKLAELKAPADAMFHRLKELTARPAAVEELKSTLTKVEELMTKWETTMPQVTEEERGDVLKKIATVREWLEEKEAAQAAASPYESVVFNSTDVPLQTKPLEKLVARLSKKPKPKPKVVEVKTDENATATPTEGEEDAEAPKDDAEPAATTTEEQEETPKDEEDDEL